VQSYHQKLLPMIESGEIDPSFVITHTIALDEAPAAPSRAKRMGASRS